MTTYIPARIASNLLSICIAVVSASIQAETLAVVPRHINSETSKPMVMFVASKDHTLFSPAFTDFEPLDTSTIETTFKPTFQYYGYFDSAKCYEYNSTDGRFNPMVMATRSTTTSGSMTSTKFSCPTSGSYWSGNFLNWATMSRMDILRKMLYGGKRSTDTLSLTVLERADLTQDAHSFVKFYAGTDIRDYTPLTTSQLTKTSGENAKIYAGLTICNRSDLPTLGGNPVMRLAKGNYRMWATIETRTCTWKDTDNGYTPAASTVKLGAKLARYYGNTNPTVHGGASIKHESALPSVLTDGVYTSLEANDLKVRVKVCDSKLLGQEQCQAREWQNNTTNTTTYKPIGLFQEFGLPAVNESAAKAEIGLLTGSYDNGLTAGALRKQIGDMTREVSIKSGRLCANAVASNDACSSSVPGAIASFDNMKLVGRTASGYGLGRNASDLQTLNDRPAWGNPIGEMLVQALNYLAGTSSRAPAGNSIDTSNNIPVATWNDPLNYSNSSSRATTYGRNVCRAINTIAISSSASSFDQSDAGFSELPNRQNKSLADFTNIIGGLEGIHGKAWAVGSASGTFGNDCKAKMVSNFSKVSGICPDAPAIAGSYLAAGAAYYANTTNIKSNLTVPNDYKGIGLRVKTSAAALAGGVPRIEITVPGTDKKVYIVPEGKWGTGNPAGLLTFSAIHSTPYNPTTGTQMASYLVTWNDVLIAGDHDMDATGYLRWDLSGGNTNNPMIKVTTDLVNVGASAVNGTHGYSIIGVNHKAAPTGSTEVQDSADGLYLTHGHSREAGAVDTPGSMCAIAAYRSTTAGAGKYTVPEYPNHEALRAISGGAVRNPCFNSSDSWTVRDVDLPVVGSFKVRGVNNVTVNDPLWYAAKYGGFNTQMMNGAENNSASSPYAASPEALPTSTWDSDTDGVPDTYFLARRPELLEHKLRQQLQQIIGSSNTAIAVSDPTLTAGNYAFKTAFNASSKSGFLYAYPRNTKNTGFSNTLAFDAGTNLSSSWNTRPVITNTATDSAIPLRWSEASGNAAIKALLTGVTDNSKDDIGEALVDHIRGARTNEYPSGKAFKARDSSTVLGPIVNSSPAVQLAPQASYTDSQFSEGEKYSAFFKNNQSRPKLVWVGSNDGMLHAFNAADGTPELSFLPKPLIEKVRRVATGQDSGMIAGMDGSPFIGDVRVKDSGDAWEWRSYVFAHLGRGGRGLFVLDSTNSQAIIDYSGTTLTTEGVAANNIFKFAFTSDDEPELGHVIPMIQRTHTSSNQPTPVVRLNNGEFAILIPNGVNSNSGTAKLIIMKAQGPGSDSTWTKGTDYFVLDTYATDSNNGMMGATWVDTNLDGKADYVYGTDLKGNVWKFDITSNNPSEWKSAFKATDGSNLPFYTATNQAGNAIPLTSEPIIFTDLQGTMVIFGSGKSNTSSDFPNSAYQQRMFAVYDKSVRDASTGKSSPRPSEGTSKLQQHIWQTIESGDYAGYAYEASYSPVAGKDEGWFFDLPGTSEMLLSTPERLFGTLVFKTHRAPDPNTTDCFVTPKIRVWALNPMSGVASGDLGTITVVVNGQSITVKVSAKPSESSTPTVAKIRNADSSGATKQCAEIVGDFGVCRALKPRLQWREVPGFSTTE